MRKEFLFQEMNIIFIHIHPFTIASKKSRPHPREYNFRFSSEFVSSCKSTANQERESLDANLRTARSAMAKDAILTSAVQLAKHDISNGNSKEAMKQLLMAKSYCSSPYQMQELFLLLAETGLNTRSFSRVKELYDPNLEDKKNASTTFLSKLNAVRGVAYLAEEQIQEAAESFLAITSNFSFNQVLSSEDLAMYGGITALLALDRKTLETIVATEKSGPSLSKKDSASLSYAAFGERLNCIPELKEALQAYVHADYAKCLRLVDEIRPKWEYDLYLAPQAESLWKRVRGKCLVQYFEPYNSVSLHSIQESFAFESVDEAEDVVADLITRGEIQGAKIDGVKKTLNSLTVEELERKKRRQMLIKLGHMGNVLLDEVEGMLERVACTQRGIVVGKSNSRGRRKGRRRDYGDMSAKDIPDYSSDEDLVGMVMEEDELMEMDDL